MNAAGHKPIRLVAVPRSLSKIETDWGKHATSDQFYNKPTKKLLIEIFHQIIFDVNCLKKTGEYKNTNHSIIIFLDFSIITRSPTSKGMLLLNPISLKSFIEFLKPLHSFERSVPNNVKINKNALVM